MKTTSIQTLFADQNDYLWIGGSQGDLHRFDTGTEEVVTYNLQTGTNLQNPQSAIIKIIQDYTGILWIISEQNIIRFDPQEPLKIPYTPISFSQESASVITDASYAPQTNSLWVATKTHGLIHYEIATQNILYLNEKQHSIQKQLPNNLSAVHVDTQNNVWTGGTQTGLIRISADDQKIQKFHQQIGYRYSLFHSQISDIISDRQGQIWIGTQGNGVHIFHEKTQIVSRYVFDRTNQYSLSHNIVNKLFLDQENLIWIATRNGISKNTPAEDQFLRYTSGHHFTNGISGQNVQAIFLDHKQGLWVGTDDGGLNFKKSGGEEWQNFVHHPQLSQSIPSNFISAICEDNNNYLWVGSDAGLFTLNSAYNSISYIYQNLDLRTIFIHKNITSCLLDTQNYMWVGTHNSGLFQINLENSTLKHYTTANSPLSSNQIQSLSFESDGYLWIGTQNGLNRLDQKSQEIKKYLTDLGIPFIINDVKIDKQNFLWVGTNIGLFRINTKDQSYKHLIDNQELPTGTIQSIEVADSENIWLSTNNGIIHLQPTQGHVTNYDETDGLAGNSFARKASAKSKNGRLYFGGIGGISSFIPDDLKPNKYSPNILITDININFTPLAEIIPNEIKNKSVWTYVKQNQQLDLPYYMNTIDFTYAATSLMAPQKNLYRVRLKSIDSNWRRLHNENKVLTYYGLAPGIYTIQLQGSNNNNFFSDETVEFNFRIHHPWWSSIWFKTILVIIFLATLFYFYNFRFNVMRKYNRLLARQVYERTKQLAERTKDLADSNQKLQQQSIIDYMSGLYNRRHFIAVAEEIEKKQLQENKYDICLILGDIDNFKQINDTYGHAIGDLAIKKTADILLHTLRSDDLVCRIGGEEFISLLKNMTFENAVKTAERLRQNISEITIPYNSNEYVTFTISIGVSLWDPRENIDHVMNRTDEALYQAKSRGRNCVVGSQHFIDQ